MSEVYDCDRCGLCCRHLLVEATSLDVMREPRIDVECPLPVKIRLPVLEATWLLGSYKDGRQGECPFLATENLCSIYPTRPNACVAFMAGSPKCQQLRTDHGLPLLAARPAKPGRLEEMAAQSVAYDIEHADEVL